MRSALLLIVVCALATAQPFPVSIRIDTNKVAGEMRPIWAFFGYDEPNYTYAPNGKKLLSQLAAASPIPVYVRAHNLLTSGDGSASLKWGSTNAYTEDASGKSKYDWTILDRIFDTYVERGMKPLVEIGFMPEALSVKPQPYRHAFSLDTANRSIEGGWAYPPKDYGKWSELVFQWVRHSVERYGRGEVESWYWEVWNEPNISYWRATPEEYYKLYDYAADGLKRALPSARIGGPHWAGSTREESVKWFRGFLDHAVRGRNYATGAMGAPLDFIAFHAKGTPRVVDGHVRMGIANQLSVIQRGFETIASFPELRSKPVILGESDPEGCAACSARVYPQNAYRNGTMYSSYTAASFARKYALADRTGANLIGAVTWAFEFEDQPWFDGFRSLATNGVEKPVLNVFRMFGLMRGQRVAAESTGEIALDSIRTEGVRGAPDVGVLASKDAHTISAMIWHYHDDELPGPDADVAVEIAGVPAPRVLLQHYRIDREHSNSYEVWKRMGSPQHPSAEQVAELERGAQLALIGSPEWRDAKAGVVKLHFSLPRQGVSLVQLSW